MPKRDSPPPFYACMMQPRHLRSVHDPQGERVVTGGGPVRTAVKRLVAAVRR